MTNSYKESMNKIKFTEQEKNQMKQNLYSPSKRSASKYTIQFASVALVFCLSLIFILKQNTKPLNTVYTVPQNHPYFLNQKIVSESSEHVVLFEREGAAKRITIKEMNTVIIDKTVYTKIEAIDNNGAQIQFKIQGGTVSKKDWDQSVGLPLPGYNEELEISIPTGYIFSVEIEENYFLEATDEDQVRLYQARKSNGVYEMYIEENNEWVIMP